MGGMLAGILSGVGQEVQKQNLLNTTYQHQANEELAQQYEKMAATVSDPKYAPLYLNAAYQLRTTPAGKANKSASDVSKILFQHIQQVHQQAQQDKAASDAAGQQQMQQLGPPPGMSPSADGAGAGAPTTPLPATMPPPPGAQAAQATPDNSGEAQGAPIEALPPPPGQSAGPTPTPAPQAAPQATPTSTQAPQIGLGAQPGQPGTGFSTGSPAPAGFDIQAALNPQPLVMPDGTVSTQFTPGQIAQRTLATEILKTNALNDAELERAKKLSEFKHKQELDTIYALSGRNPDGTPGAGPGQPITWSTTAAGHTVAKPDLGHPVSGIVLNAKGQPVRLIRYNDPIHYPDREIPVPNYAGKVQMQKADGTAGWFAQDKSGNIIDEITTPGATAYAPPGYAPTVTDSSNQTVKPELGADGQMHNVVETLNTHRTTKKQNPGSGGVTTPAPAPTLAPPPGGGARSTSPAPKGGDGASASGFHGRDLGPTPSQYKMNVENPLTTNGQTAMADTDPVLKAINRAMAIIEPVKDSNDPLHYSLSRLGYSVGLETEASNLINNLEMGKVVGAARILKGASRSYTALQIAMQHLPDPKKDSPKLMYEKLQNIKQNLTDIQTAAQTNERKYPGMTPPPLAAPPSDSIPESARKLLVEGVPTTFKNGQTWTLKNGQPVRSDTATVH